MIDPQNIINYNYTDAQLEELLIFGVCVAGKTARIIAPKVDAFLKNPGGLTPFAYIRQLNAHPLPTSLVRLMRFHNLGKYHLLEISLSSMASKGLNLRKCSVKDLEEIYGVGPKTARMFMLSSRPNQRLAALDTHVLKYLNAQGIQAPKSTPSSKKLYAKLELEVLKLADASGLTPAEFDLRVWKSYAKHF